MTQNEDSKIPLGLLKHAESRSTDIVEKIRAAIASIEADIEQHAGIYPYNKARVTKNEVCRRAGVNPMTLQGRTHRKTTNVMVEEFLDRVKAGLILGKLNIRRAVTDRAESWKRQHDLIANEYHIAVLDRIRFQAALRIADQRNKELERELSELKRQVAKASLHNIIPFDRGD